jgi:Uma2 family endonuclease
MAAMSASQEPMTLEAFLEWEERQPLKYEFDGIRVRAMTGGSVNHSRVQRNLLSALTNRLRGGPCEPFGSDMKVITSHGARYPDASVVCVRLPGAETSTQHATIVFEVLSPSTSGVDRFEKNQEYRDTPSIQRYVILEQDRLAATVFNRENSDWTGHLVTGEIDLSLPEIGISIPLAEIYEGVELAIDPQLPA